jgi:putative nucleotidyltransferase with HDIG domain
MQRSLEISDTTEKGRKKMKILRIRADQACAGMVVASDIYSENNQLVISKGVTLDDRMIVKLRFYRIYGLNVYEKEEEKKNENEKSYIGALRKTPDFKKFNRTYVKTANAVHNTFNDLIRGDDTIHEEVLMEEVNQILQEGRNKMHVMEMLHGIRDYDDAIFIHSVNVALICNILAGWLRFSTEDMNTITLAGLLHDIGKMKIPREIMLKPGILSKEEYKTIQTHSIWGFEILKDQPVDLRVKYAALMHHERCDGSGYPNGFMGDQINYFAKIVAIADVYDAMTCNRNYRKKMCPFYVVESFEREGFLKYDPKYLMIFLGEIVQSYLHNTVRLSDGREGEVVLINKLALSKPMVKVGDEFIDLSKESHLTIEAVI